MEQRKIKTAFIICIVLFAVALVLSAVFSRDGAAQFESSGTMGHVVLSEILPGNLTYPAPDGGFYDFIEVRNLSASPVDISGYMLSDRTDAIGYTFPKGTVLEGNGYILCWCLSGSDRADMGNFGISRSGSDTIYLYNGANVVVDRKQVTAAEDNASHIRLDDGSWSITTLVTPGFANDRAGYDAWLASMGAGHVGVIITEVMTAADCVSLDGSGTVCDWVELYNGGTTEAVLSGSYLSDDPQEPLKWQIGQLTLAPGEYAVIRCSGEDGTADAPFALPRSGCTVTLTGPLGNTVSTLTCPALGADESWALRDDGSFAATAYATPGFQNSEDGYLGWLERVGARQTSVVISEIMSANRGTITCAAGVLCDWVELYNGGTSDAVLSGTYLSDDPEDRGKWRLPDITLAPGEYLVIPCAGSYASAGEADFALPASGCTVTLTGSAGNIISAVTCPSLEDDRVYALQSDGSYRITDLASPGYENTEDGALVFRASHRPSTGLVISEVMPSNDRFLLQTDGKYHDWIELYNDSNSAIDLSDYTLSDDPENPNKLALPQKTLAPGARIVIICSGDASLSGKYIQAPFTLSRDECWVYLSDTDGRLCDWLRVSDVPYQGSAGRPDGEYGTCYFTTPTPGTPNGTGVALICAAPQVLTAEGVYNGVSDLCVELGGKNLHYTLDGRVPTQSDPLYTGPITLTGTTVLRVAGFEEGKLPSDIVTASFIINENHTLPVVSLTADPDALFSEFSGIYGSYTQDDEIPGNLKLFEDGNGFSIDCGIELYGQAGSELAKKSFKINFRSRYGSGHLGYPLYGEDGPQVYDTLVLYAGADHQKSIFRDELLTGLCLEFSDSVPAQRYKFCILYINGEYWGIYAMKEAFGETFYAQNAGVSEQSVEIVRAPAPYLSEVYRLTQYGLHNDMTLDESYTYLASQIDMDSLADWMVLQSYSGSGDIGQDLRYFRSSENGGKWQLTFSDRDEGFLYDGGLADLFSGLPATDCLDLTRTVIVNPAFREKFLSRMGQAMRTVLSDEHVRGRIDALAALLSPEIGRERERWNGSPESWLWDVQYLRDFIGDGDHWDMILQTLRSCIGLTDEEEAKYFWEVHP